MRDPFIAESMAQHVHDALDTVAREHGVRILLAVESGSRAWRFPSTDSDYDVRFIYVHPLARYLSLAPLRDVIETPPDAGLDLGGWDLRKALQHVLRSNAVMLEWLTSPIRYREAEDVPARLLALARAHCDLPALAYHYDRLARRSFDPLAAGGTPVRLKAYCYAVRAVLALEWLRLRASPPPMDLPALLGGVPIPDQVGGAVAALVARKAEATEADAAPRVPVLDNFLAAALAAKPERPAAVRRTHPVADADALFADILGVGSVAPAAVVRE